MRNVINYQEALEIYNRNSFFIGERGHCALDNVISVEDALKELGAEAVQEVTSTHGGTYHNIWSCCGRSIEYLNFKGWLFAVSCYNTLALSDDGKKSGNIIKFPRGTRRRSGSTRAARVTSSDKLRSGTQEG